MRDVSKPRFCTAAAALTAVAIMLGMPAPTRAGKLSWLDEVVQEVVREAEASGKALARGSEEATLAARGTSRLFAREGEESLEIIARRSDDLARAGRRGVEVTSEALLEKRFTRLLPHDLEGARTFASLAPAEKRLVVEMGETAQRLARRYPGQADRMIKELGTDGMSAVRVFGDDVAEVLVKEGPETLGILRKTGRGGWEFFTSQVLPHKKKLLAAGVMAAFLANPDKFVDYAGQATEYAVREFAKAGVNLAGAVTGGAARGLEATVAEVLAPYGLNFSLFRHVGMVLAALVALGAAMVLLGLPLRWLLRPVTWPLRTLLGWRKAHAAS